MKNKPATVDAYIAGFPKEVQKKLNDLRAVIKKTAPKAEETIKYGIPTYVQQGNVLSFSAWKDHIGIYPRIGAMQKEQAPFASGQGTLKFPIDKALPLALIRKIVSHRVKEHLAKVKARALKKKI